MAKNKYSFGLRMMALKWAKQLLAKEALEIKERYPSVSPIPELPKAEGKPLEATTPTPIKEVVKYIEVSKQDVIQNTIQHLREIAKKYE